MRLYGYWRSSASWRVRIALRLKGVHVEPVPVNLRAGDQREAPHLARSPLGQLPVLEWEESGRTHRLTQSLAILDWLEHRFPDPPLYPADPERRAHAIALAEVVNAGTQPLQNASVLAHLAELGVDREAWAARFIAEGLRALQALAEPHAGTYLVGDTVTVADVCLVPQLYNARRFGVELAPRGLLTAVESRLAALPAFAEAHAERQPDAPPNPGP